MAFKRLLFVLTIITITNTAFSQDNNSNTVPNGIKVEQATAPSANTKTSSRWQQIEKLLNRTRVVGDAAIQSINLTTHDASQDLSVEITRLKEKYSHLLNILPSMISSIELIESIDEWFGTRYLYGGTTKYGIDCSAFVRAALKSAFGYQLPRTAREQYKASRRISATELREGDLVFFNTTGGVSHVGIYINNYKFAHSSCSKGVTISDLYDPYYLTRYIGAGRIEKPDFMAKN